MAKQLSLLQKILAPVLVSLSLGGCTPSDSPVYHPDLNNDGKPEIVWVENYIGESHINVSEINPQGESNTRTIKTVYNIYPNIKFGDYNGDGNKDLSYRTTFDRHSRYFLPGNGDGTFQDPVKLE